MQDTPEWTMPSEGRMLPSTLAINPTLTPESLAARAARRDSEMPMKTYLLIMRREHNMTAHAACKLMLESGEVE